MPKIQELQRYWVHQVEDQDATPLGSGIAEPLQPQVLQVMQVDPSNS